MRLLVCGGRTYGVATATKPAHQAVAERLAVRATLDAIHAQDGIAILIHGAAPGADRRMTRDLRIRLEQQALWVRMAVLRHWNTERVWWRARTRCRGNLRAALAYRRDYVLGARGLPLP